MRRMPSLRTASVAFKAQHRAACVLSRKCGTTPARIGSDECERIAWNSKKLQCADIQVLATLSRFIPYLSSLDMRFNEIRDSGLLALARASSKGWLPHLTVLGLSNNAITTSGAVSLAKAATGSPPAFGALEQLSLMHNAIDGEGMAALALAMGDGALPRLITFELDSNASDDAMVQQALLQPSEARLAAAKRAGGNAWEYVAGNSVNTLATGCGYFGRCWLRQAAVATSH